MRVSSIKKIYHTPVRLTAVVVVLGVTLLAMYVIVSTNTPQSAGPLGVTSFLLLFFVAILSTITLVKMLLKRTSKVSLQGLIGVALIPTIIIGLNSLRQLSVVDIVLIVLFAALINLYIKKALSSSDS